ncbi:hypothetical protein Bbelb_075960 [Branchiostoma belcheri]|nr:hypothetical protein Bbelb_075960 [Branchiostoma belcheri]
MLSSEASNDCGPHVGPLCRGLMLITQHTAQSRDRTPWQCVVAMCSQLYGLPLIHNRRPGSYRLWNSPRKTHTKKRRKFPDPGHVMWRPAHTHDAARQSNWLALSGSQPVASRTDTVVAPRHLNGVKSVTARPGLQLKLRFTTTAVPRKVG